MKAIILAAGSGSRMGSLTETRPKCLLEFAGRTLLGHTFHAMGACGIARADVTLVGGYKAGTLPGDDVDVVVNPRYETTNMVVSLFHARAVLEAGEDVVISYGDIVYEPRVLRAVVESDAPIALAIDENWRDYWSARMENPLDDAETLELADDGRVLGLGRKPTSYDQIQGQYMGLFKIRADVLASVIAAHDALEGAGDPGFDNMYMTDFVQHLIDIGTPVQSVPVAGGWLEFDTPEDLELYRSMQGAGRLAPFFRPSPEDGGA